jgi:2-polyprenyl-3-methyl-5-hydroxy-6-metoxy-1,4-benzoquinol methylase
MMSALETAVFCPDCASQARSYGVISATEVFAGRILEYPIAGGALYRCSNCQLGFRWPRLTKSEFDNLYAQGGDQAWTSSVHLRRDWRLACARIAQSLSLGASILDVGCFDGGFLEGLVGSYRCFGIEIHPQARLQAQGKGITLVGRDFSDIAGQFDCITTFDVIEHVENPARFLSQCLDAVRLGGYVLISTGNLDALTFRLMGSRYWYCTIAEHISFVSPIWFAENKLAMGFEIEYLKTFTHDNAPIARRLRDLIVNALYWVHPAMLGALRALGFGERDVRRHPMLVQHPPSWWTARDHFMVVLRKL